MLPAGSLFPAPELASSKGGRTNLAEIFTKGTTVVAVLPPDPTEALFDALVTPYPKWLLEHFFNVYYVTGASLEKARAWADGHGLQAALLHDDTGALTAHPGVYRVTGGVVERAADFHALASLV